MCRGSGSGLMGWRRRKKKIHDMLDFFKDTNCIFKHFLVKNFLCQNHASFKNEVKTQNIGCLFTEETVDSYECCKFIVNSFKF